MRCRDLRAFALILAASCVIARSSYAQQEPTPHDKAIELFKQSDEAYKQGNFRDAAHDLEAAYALEPAPVLLYNLARAYEGMGEVEAAIAAYERYLKVQPDAEDRGLIQKRLEALHHQLDLQAQAKAPPPPPPPPPPHATHARPLGPAPIVVTLVGVAGLAAGGVFGSLALADNGKQNDPATSQLDAKRLHDEGASFATVSNIAFIAGGIVTLAGLVWILVDRLTASSASASASASASTPTHTPFVIRF